MTDEQKPRIVRMPSDEEMHVKFEAYALAVGRVAHAWNMLDDRLSKLFVVITGARDPRVSVAIWFSSESDRAKQRMLKDAINAYLPQQWPWEIKSAKADLIWLVNEASNLAEDRNNAIHAPCTLVTDHESTEIVASPFSGHDRARKLRGKRVLLEFKWIEQWCDALTTWAQSAETGLSFPGRYPWPERPSKPERQPKATSPIS